MKAKREKLFNYAKQKAAEDASFWDKLKASKRMIRAHAKKEYKIDWKTIFFVIGALAYAIFPADFITDLIPVVGWVDDFTILGFAFNQLNKEINKFLQWEVNKNPYPNMDVIDAEVID